MALIQITVPYNIAVKKRTIKTVRVVSINCEEAIHNFSCIVGTGTIDTFGTGSIGNFAFITGVLNCNKRIYVFDKGALPPIFYDCNNQYSCCDITIGSDDTGTGSWC